MTVTEEMLGEMTRRLVADLQPEQIILFGSQVWGAPDEGSDVDLFVVLPDERLVGPEQHFTAQRCLWGLTFPVDIVLRSRAHVERFRPVPASLEALVFSRGRVLYDRREARARTRLADAGVS